jgi:TRAP-type C4-dicarboxylate transport system permease small subunit
MLTNRKVTILREEIEPSKDKIFMSKLAQRLVVLFFLFFILFSFPILNVFWKSNLVLGVPLIYLYIFGTWLLLIICLIWLMEFRGKQN